MKPYPVRRFAIVMALGIVVAACGGDGGTANETGDGSTSATAPGEAEITDEAVEQSAAADAVTITIESWRSDDAAIWDEQIIPAFEAQFPHIDVAFTPTAPIGYDAALDARLAAGTAGDVIACRPFDASLALFERGDLASLIDLPGVENFSPVAKIAWSTDDGSTPFCVPVASVIHGFIYNKTAFDELGLVEPRTEEEFFELLGAISDDGSYVPLSMGTADRWEAATMGFENIGPNYWKGEEGRRALIGGTAKLTDRAYVDTLATLQRWSEYLADGASALTYADAQHLFTLGGAAVYPAGSWEIAGFNAESDFELGAFPPPPRAGQDTCYLSDHTDIGLGLNAASGAPEAARTFLAWVASSEFARVLVNALPGFFSLQDSPVASADLLAQEFSSWRDDCESTIRISSHMLSRGEPRLEDELRAVSVGVLTGGMDPVDGARRLGAALDAWHTPAG